MIIILVTGTLLVFNSEAFHNNTFSMIAIAGISQIHVRYIKSDLSSNDLERFCNNNL